MCYENINFVFVFLSGHTMLNVEHSFVSGNSAKSFFPIWHRRILGRKDKIELNLHYERSAEYDLDHKQVAWRDS